MPCAPPLTELLHQNLVEFGTAADGRLIWSARVTTCPTAPMAGSGRRRGRRRLPRGPRRRSRDAHTTSGTRQCLRG